MEAPLLPSAIHHSTSYFDYLYYTSLILLYRPSPADPCPDSACVLGCGDSSIQVIRTYDDGFIADKMKWIWISLCQIYASGLTLLWCVEQNLKALENGRKAPWTVDEKTIQYGVDAVILLLEEFEKRKNGVERLWISFQKRSRSVTQRASSSSVSGDDLHDSGDLVVWRTSQMEYFGSLINWFDSELSTAYAL